MSARESKRLENWTDEKDSIFLDLLRQQHDDGRRSGKNFTKDGWNATLQGFVSKANAKITKDQLKNRWKWFCEYFRAYRALRNKSGWGWDSANNKPIAPCRDVWEGLIKVCYSKEMF